MKLNTTLPSKYLTEGNPVIGLSFEVGYRRLLVMVGETIIFKMSNMIRADVDSEICNCPPGYMYLAQLPYGGMSGGFNRVGMGRPQTAYTPASRSHFAHKGEVLDYSEEALKKDVGFLQVIGRMGYNDTQESFARQILEARRAYKTKHPERIYGEYPHPRQLINQLTNYEIYHRSGSMPNVGTIGHIDHGRYPSYLTKAMYEKQMREAGIEIPFGGHDDTVRKLHNNGSYAGPSGHSSLTAMCRNYKLTDMHGDRGVIPRVKVASAVHDYTSMRGRTPVITDLANRYIRDAVFRRVEAYLTDKYYFTGEGMLPKDL
jgi:hypothetical protein